MFNILEDVTLEQVQHNFVIVQGNNRTANFNYIAAGALVALKVNNLLDAKDKLAKLFDTKVSKEADFRLAALRMVKHHRNQLNEAIANASNIEHATTLLASYISTTYANETGAVYGKLNGKNVCLPRLSLFDVKKDKAEREADATSKQEHEQEAALNTLAPEQPVQVVDTSTICNFKKVESTIATICKMLAEDGEGIHPARDELVFQLGVITGAIDVQSVEITALIQQAKADFQKILEGYISRELKAA